VDGRVDLGTAVAVRVYSPCPGLHIAVAVVINTTASGEIQPQSGVLPIDRCFLVSK